MPWMGPNSSHGNDQRMWRPEPDGPQGPMQVSAAAAADAGGGDRFDLTENRALGRAYLARLYRRYGSWTDAIAAYNWGPGHLDGWIGGGRPVDKFPPAVARYRNRVLVTSGLPAAEGGELFSNGPIFGWHASKDCGCKPNATWWSGGAASGDQTRWRCSTPKSCARPPPIPPDDASGSLSLLHEARPWPNMCANFVYSAPTSCSPATRMVRSKSATFRTVAVLKIPCTSRAFSVSATASPPAS